MWNLRNITARTLIWLAAIALPVQTLPAASCGCSGSTTSCNKAEGTSGCCCSQEKVRQGRCCCSRKLAASRGSCCSGNRQVTTTGYCCSQGESGCTCGVTCRCGTTKQPTPAAPPVENNSSDSLAYVSHSASPAATADQPKATRRQDDSSSVSDALAALDRCVSLCRFVL